MIYETCVEWGQCREAMLPAIEMTAGTHNEDDVIAGICTGQFRLWRNGSSGVVTDITMYPRLKCFNIFLMGGKLEEITPMFPKIEAYAKEQGCQRITALAARKGWERYFAETCKMGGSFMYKDI